MHMLQRSEHLVRHALYQSQIIYLVHNDILAWDGEVRSAFTVIFKNEHASERPIHMKSLSTFHGHLKSALYTWASNIFAIWYM